MDIQELIELSRQGLIPGPGETEQMFCKRVALTKAAFAERQGSIPAHHWDWAKEQLRHLFDFSPNWIGAFYSAKGLAPWQAAATWVDVKQLYSIQIKPSKWLSWMVDIDEVLAHEAAHAARAAFNEPKSEEVFAYLTSSAKWRKVLGPLFQTPKEALSLVSLLCLGAVGSLVEIFWEIPLSSWCFFIASGLGTWWMFRLFFTRLNIHRAGAFLKPYLRDFAHLRAVLFRLTDAEMASFAKGRKIKRSDELRWQLLRALYFTEQANEELWRD